MKNKLGEQVDVSYLEDEKKQFMRTFIESIELYPEKNFFASGTQIFSYIDITVLFILYNFEILEHTLVILKKR